MSDLDFCYSTDGEDFNYYDIEDTFGFLDVEIGGETTVSRGVPIMYNATDFFSVDQMFDHAAESAYETCGEYAESWFPLPENAVLELKKDLEKMINDWATKHALHPTFYSIKDVVEITVKRTGEDKFEALPSSVNSTEPSESEQ